MTRPQTRWLRERIQRRSTEEKQKETLDLRNLFSKYQFMYNVKLDTFFFIYPFEN